MDNKDLRLSKWYIKPYSFWSFFRFLPKNIKYFFTRYLKYRRQRIRRGFADCDVWNLDDYILKVLADGLREFVKQTNCYPDNLFPTFEAWRDHLTLIADDLDWIKVDATDNEYWNDKILEKECSEEEHKWFERIKEIEDEKRKHILKGLHAFAEVYDDIWW